MLDQILKLDESLFIYLNNLGTEFWDPFWLLYTEKWAHIPLILVFLFFMHKVFGTKKLLVSLLVIALMITVTDQLTNLAKHGFKRPRPCRVPELEGVIRYIAKRCSRYGYFSGHSSNSMAIALFLGSILKNRFKYVFFFVIPWALAMGYSRIYIGVHYPADLLTGFTVGLINGCLFFKLFKFLEKKYLVVN